MIFNVGIFALIILQIGDIVTTNIVLENGGREDNPFGILQWAMKEFGRAWWIVKIGFAGVFIVGLMLIGPWSTDFLGLNFRPLPIGWMALSVFIFYYAYAVIHHIQVIKRQEARK